MYRAWNRQFDEAREERKWDALVGGDAPRRGANARALAFDANAVRLQNPYPAGSWKHELFDYFTDLDPLERIMRLRQIAVHFSLINKVIIRDPNLESRF